MRGAGRDVRRSRLRRGCGACRRRGTRRHRRPSGAVQEPAVLPQRRPRLLLQGGRPRRPAGGRPARHPLLRLGSLRPSSPPTWWTTSSPSTPPGGPRTRACAATRRSSSPPCCDRARGPGLRRRVHRALRPARAGSGQRRGTRDGAAPGRRRRQGPVVRARGARPRTSCGRVLFPLGDSLKSDVRAEAERRGLAVADKPDSHDICFIADGDTAGFLDRPARHPARADHRRVAAPRWGEHDGHPPLHRRAAQGAAARDPGRRREAALRAGHLTGDQHRHGGPREALSVRRIAGVRPSWTDRPESGSWRGLVQVRAHGEPVPAEITVEADGVVARSGDAR